MPLESRVSYYVDRYGIFHRILRKDDNSVERPNINVTPKVCSTWLRLIMMFWNVKVMKAAFRFGVAAIIMNQYERLGFAVLLLCFAL